MMDVFNDPFISETVIMAGAQVGKTEIANNIIGYCMDQAPCPILNIQPTLNIAETYSKRRLAPMVRDTPCLQGKLKDPKSKNSDNTILEKSFPGGYIALVGSNSTAGLAGRPMKHAIFDEVDRYETTTEGDPIKLGEQRTSNFWDSKKLKVSTPTVKGVSRIEKDFKRSDQRYYYVPCPKCKKHQRLTWENVKWDKEDDGAHLIDTAYYQCESCGKHLNDSDINNAVKKGKWIKTAKSNGIAGFAISALYSPWVELKKLVAEWIDAQKDPDLLQVFINTKLGEPWEEKGTSLEYTLVMDRCEEYKHEVPDGVLILTAAVDVQVDRLEVEVLGWGTGKENWGIEFKKIMGSPLSLKTWELLDQYLLRSFKNSKGKLFTPQCVCVDSGYKADEVYSFCAGKEFRRIFPIKGVGGFGLPLIGKYSRNNRKKVALFSIGVDTGKDTIMARLKIPEPGHGYCHFPSNPEKGYTKDYFKGLMSEKRVMRQVKGKIIYTWEKLIGRKNEPLDIRNYNNAALEILNPNFDLLSKESNRVIKLNTNNSAPASNGAIRRRRIISKGIS